MVGLGTPLGGDKVSEELKREEVYAIHSKCQAETLWGVEQGGDPL